MNEFLAMENVACLKAAKILNLTPPSAKAVLVVAGCGTAGAELVRHLDGLDVVVISPSPVLVCQALLPYYIAGKIEEKDLSVNLKSFFREKGITYREGKIELIKTGCNTLFVSHRSGTIKGVGYDFAVIAIGGESCYYGVDCSNCLSVNTLEEAKIARERISSGGKIVVVGSGMTGVETAYELSEFCKVMLVEAQSRILPAMSKKASNYVLKLLERRGVDVLTSCRVEEISYDEGIVKTSCGELSFDEVVWCAGVRGRKLSGLKYNRMGISVDTSLKAQKNVFAIGDCAEIVINGEVATKTALEAERQARFVAKLVSRAIKVKAGAKYDTVGLSCAKYKPFSTNRRPFAILTFGEKGLVIRGDKIISYPPNLIYKLKMMVVKKFLNEFKV